jgi:hypothetical protein
VSDHLDISVDAQGEGGGRPAHVEGASLIVAEYLHTRLGVLETVAGGGVEVGVTVREEVIEGKRNGDEWSKDRGIQKSDPKAMREIRIREIAFRTCELKT